MVRVQRAGVGGWHLSGLPCTVDRWLCVVPAILAPRWGINGSWCLVWVWGHHHWGPCPSLTVGGSLWAHLRLHCNGSHDCYPTAVYLGLMYYLCTLLLAFVPTLGQELMPSGTFLVGDCEPARLTGWSHLTRPWASLRVTVETSPLWG